MPQAPAATRTFLNTGLPLFGGVPHRVADLSPETIAFGRREIELAEHEMPGLMAIRERYAVDRPLAGARITGSLHMTIQTAVLIETLLDLGAEVRWASCNIYSTQDHAAAAVVAGRGGDAHDLRGPAVFAWKGETLAEYWWCTAQAFDWPDGRGPSLILDDGGDATLLVHKGVECERTGAVPAPESAENEETAVIYSLLAAAAEERPGWLGALAAGIVGVTEETTTGVHRLARMHREGSLLFPAINVNDSVTKSKFDNVYGIRHSLVDGLMRGTDVMLSGKLAVVLGYGEVGKGAAQSLAGQKCRIVVTEVDPICALQALMDGYQVVRLEDVVDEADVFVTTTGNVRVIGVEHMRRMKRNAIVGNVGHFDNEIDMAGLAAEPGIRRQNIKPQVDVWIFAGRTADPGAFGGTAAQPRERDRPSQLRDEFELCEPGARTTGTAPAAGALRPRGPRTAEASRRGSRPSASRQARSAAHPPDAGAERLHRRPDRRALQTGYVPVLTA